MCTPDHAPRIIVVVLLCTVSSSIICRPPPSLFLSPTFFLSPLSSPLHLPLSPSIAVLRPAGVGLLRRFHCSDILSSGMYFCQLSSPPILLLFGTLLETRLRACAYVTRLTSQRSYRLAATDLFLSPLALQLTRAYIDAYVCSRQ